MHVLPAECIICQKSARLDIKKQGKRVKEPLSNCEIVNGGRILEQAINEQNTRILRLIQHQDCVALEVKYHATCYLNYTRPLTRKGNKQQHDRQYTESFKKFCKDVVEEKLIKEEKAWELVALKKKFVQGNGLLLLRLVGLLGLSRGDLLDERGDHRELLGELVEVWENLSLSLGQIFRDHQYL